MDELRVNDVNEPGVDSVSDSEPIQVVETICEEMSQPETEAVQEIESILDRIL